MDELTRFCTACQKEKEILQVERDAEGAVIRMSCGHSHITTVVSETVRMFEGVYDEVKRQGKTVVKGKHKTKVSGETKRLARESLNLDWKTRTICHKVLEQDPKGDWVVVHVETKPFAQKKVV